MSAETLAVANEAGITPRQAEKIVQGIWVALPGTSRKEGLDEKLMRQLLISKGKKLATGVEYRNEVVELARRIHGVEHRYWELDHLWGRWGSFVEDATNSYEAANLNLRSFRKQLTEICESFREMHDQYEVWLVVGTCLLDVHQEWSVDKLEQNQKASVIFLLRISAVQLFLATQPQKRDKWTEVLRDLLELLASLPVGLEELEEEEDALHNNYNQPTVSKTEDELSLEEAQRVRDAFKRVNEAGNHKPGTKKRLITETLSERPGEWILATQLTRFFGNSIEPENDLQTRVSELNKDLSTSASEYEIEIERMSAYRAIVKNKALKSSSEKTARKPSRRAKAK